MPRSSRGAVPRRAEVACPAGRLVVTLPRARRRVPRNAAIGWTVAGGSDARPRQGLGHADHQSV